MQPPPGPPPNPWGPPPGAPPGPPPGPVGGYGVGLPPGVSVQAAYAPAGGGTEPMGITSLVLGVVSLPLYLCCGALSLVLNIVGVVLAFVSLKRVNSRPDLYSGRGIPIAALVVNGLFLLLNILMMLFVFGIMGLGLLKP